MGKTRPIIPVLIISSSLTQHKNKIKTFVPQFIIHFNLFSQNYTRTNDQWRRKLNLNFYQQQIYLEVLLSRFLYEVRIKLLFHRRSEINRYKILNPNERLLDDKNVQIENRKIVGDVMKRMFSEMCSWPRLAKCGSLSLVLSGHLHS